VLRFGYRCAKAAASCSVVSVLSNPFCSGPPPTREQRPGQPRP